MRRMLLVLLLVTMPAGMPLARFDPFAEVDITGRPGDAVPMDAFFTDTGGNPVTFRGISEGKPILLAPVYYNCPNVCMVTLDNLLATLSAMKLVPGRDFVVVAYSIDPREGPADAKRAGAKALQRFSRKPEEPGFHFLTGSAATIRRMSESIGFRFAWDEAIAQYAHAAAVATVTPEGRLSRWVYGVGYTPLELRLALVDAGNGATGSLTDRLLLLCYRYDPQTGRYTSLVNDIVISGGLLTVISICSLIGFFLWREHHARRTGGERP